MRERIGRSLIILNIFAMLALPWYDAILNQPHEEVVHEGDSDHDEAISSEDAEVCVSGWARSMDVFWKDSVKSNRTTVLSEMLGPHLALCLDPLRSDYFFTHPIVTQTLLQYLETKESCDVKLSTNDGVSYDCHKLLLAIHSEYYRTLFLDTWWSGHESCAVQVDCDASTLHAILLYLYSGSIVHIAQSGNAIECLKIGHMLLISSLIEDLLPSVMESVDDDNACSLMAFAETLGFKRLQEKAAMFVIRRLSKIEQSQYFADLSPRIQEAIRVLHGSYVRCTTVNGDLYNDVRELLAMIKDSLVEAERTLERGKVRNEEEIMKWTEASGGQQFHFKQTEANPDNTVRVSSILESDLEEWRARLLRVEASLGSQQLKLVRMRDRYEEQRKALDALLVWVQHERVTKDEGEDDSFGF